MMQTDGDSVLAHQLASNQGSIFRGQLKQRREDATAWIAAGTSPSSWLSLSSFLRGIAAPPAALQLHYGEHLAVVAAEATQLEASILLNKAVIHSSRG